LMVAIEHNETQYLHCSTAPFAHKQMYSYI